LVDVDELRRQRLRRLDRWEGFRDTQEGLHASWRGPPERLRGGDARRVGEVDSPSKRRPSRCGH